MSEISKLLEEMTEKQITASELKDEAEDLIEENFSDFRITKVEVTGVCFKVKLPGALEYEYLEEFEDRFDDFDVSLLTAEDDCMIFHFLRWIDGSRRTAKKFVR